MGTVHRFPNIKLATPVVMDRRGSGRGYTLPGKWDEIVDRWVAWLRLTGVSPTTIRLRRGQVRVVARRSQTEHPRELTTSHVIDICSDPSWSNDHRKGVRTSLLSFYEWAIGQGFAQVNPAEVLPRVKESRPNPRPAPDFVWLELLDKATPREALMAMLACEAGMRRSEVACSHRQDLIEDIHGFSLIVHGKGGKQRVVPITSHLAHAIKAYTDHGFLFPGQVNGHISPDRVGRVISRLMPAGWSMHKLRHRYATRGYAGTGNLRAVQEVLGHVSVATTQKYVAVGERDLRTVSEAAHLTRYPTTERRHDDAD